MLTFALRYQDRIYCQSLENNQRITFGSGKKDNIFIREMSQEQLCITGGSDKLAVQTRAPFAQGQTGVPLGSVVRLDETTGTSIFASLHTGISTTVATLPYDGIVRVGRAEANDIVLGLPFVSGSHFLLRISDGNIRVEDQDSRNGLYLNGLRIKAAMLRPGDVLNILTVSIRLVNGQLQFENAGTAVKVNLSAPAPKAAPRSQAKFLRHRLSPRIQDQLPQDPVVLDRPPKKGQQYHPNGSRLASMLSMGAMAGASLAMGMASPALAFARTVSLAANVYNLAAGSKMDKQRQAEIEDYNRRREEEYKTYIEAQKARIMAVAQEQRRIITEENPDPAQCIEMAQQLDRRIWERMTCDRDFLDVRLGMGYEPLCVPIKNYAENRGLLMEDDELEDLCNTIAEENQLVDYIPARLSLKNASTIGIVGDRDRAVHLVRNMLVSLTAHHCPNDVQLVGVFDNAERTRWASLRWLPHIWDNDHQFRYLSFDRERTHRLCEILHDQLKRRLDVPQDTYGKVPAPTPHYVILLGSREMVEDEPLMQLLSSNDPRLGVTTLFLYDDLYYLPRQCSYFIDLSEEYPSVYSKQGANRRFVFSRDPAVSSVQFNAYARRLAAIELRDDSKRSALPASISFMEGLGIKNVEQLNVLQRWRDHAVSDSLSAPVGVLASGKPFCLDIHYKAHGAHGLLAGTTGSGKSELLRAWILSMAVNYHPHEVNFVIIDYKGGGMANKLDALPHVVGKITNIDSNINRTLVSLKREAKRRMKLLEGYPGVDDVDQYMQLYYAGKTTEPMPHLIIVSDEFAELKKEEPEFMKELNTLARVGRSVGIHLLLATQRPTGLVDDQIDSNSRFRICMKVNSVQDSKDILKKPDAAGITQRGRAYVRVGEDEIFELFQSYWSGAEYAPEETISKQISNQVSIVDVSGERISVGAAKKKVPIGGDQLTAIVGYINDQAQLAGIPALEGPWKPELPTVLPLQSLAYPIRFSDAGWSEAEGALLVPIGMYDRPAMQEQGIQVMNFTAKPHYGIYGGPGSGKTTLLQTMILSLALQFSPQDVNLHILDFGGRSLSIFEELPHTATVIRENDEDKLWQFAGELRQEIARRKQLFEKEKVANFDQYRRKNKAMPSIFLVIDNLLRLNTLYEAFSEVLNEVAMSGSDCGIHLVFTSNNINKTSMNLRTNVGGSIALHMTDRNDYRTAVAELPEGCAHPVNPGRALIRDTAAAEFQTAIFLQSQDETENRAVLEKLIGAMKAAWGNRPTAGFGMGNGPASLPEAYTQRQLLPVGRSALDGAPVFADLRRKSHFIISTQTQAQATKAISDLAQLLSSRADNAVTLLDGNGDAADLEAAVNGLVQQVQLRDDIWWKTVDSCMSTEGIFDAQPQLCILLLDADLVMKKLTPENRELLLQMCTMDRPLGIMAVAVGTTLRLGAAMCNEALTIALVDAPLREDSENRQQGLCIGGRLADHDSFQLGQVPTGEKKRHMEENAGVWMENGSATALKEVLV